MASELEDRTVEAKAAQERCKAAEDGRSRAEEQLAAATSSSTQQQAATTSSNMLVLS